MNEIWKDIKDYEDYYEVSNLGNVRSKGREYVDKLGRCRTVLPIKRKIQKLKIGYLAVDLNVNGGKEKKFVHRLIAEAFLPNPENKQTVNHKDGNKLNNDISNLEWVTYSENNKHATDTGLRKSPWIDKFGEEHPNSKPVIQLDKNGNVLNRFTCAREANRKTGINYKYISRCCLGERMSTGGFIWKFETN